MSHISIDIIGPIKIPSQNTTRNARKKKFCLLLVVCIHTGLAEFVMMEDITTTSVVIAVLTIQQVYGPIVNILADRETQFGFDYQGFHQASNQE